MMMMMMMMIMMMMETILNHRASQECSTTYIKTPGPATHTTHKHPHTRIHPHTFQKYPTFPPRTIHNFFYVPCLHARGAALNCLALCFFSLGCFHDRLFSRSAVFTIGYFHDRLFSRSAIFTTISLMTPNRNTRSAQL